MNFQWQVEHDMFVLYGYAAFKRGVEILSEFLTEYADELKPDIKERGEDRIKKYVYDKVRILSPRSKKFPRKYKTQFESLRREWTEEAKNVRGYHRTARLQTLNDLLEEILARPIDEGEKPSYTYKDRVLLILKTISEMRLEGDKSQIHIKAHEVAQPNTFDNEVESMFQKFTNEQMEEIRKLQDAGKPIQPLIERYIRDSISSNGSGRTALTDGIQSGGDAA